MKQTAVEFLLEKYKSQNNLLFWEDFEQANKMFEEHIIDAFCEDNYEYNGYRQISLSGQQYYNETFKPE